MKHLLCSMLCVCLFAQPLFAQPETEPNNTRATANLIQEGGVITGTVQSTAPADPDDYFKTYPNDDGTIVLRFSFNGSSAGDDFYFYAYNKAGSQIGLTSRANTLSGADSLLIYCRQRDTVYFRVNCGGAYSYQFSYSSRPSGLADAEPNNAFAEAVRFLPTDTVRGRIGYLSVAQDVADYYYSVLPSDGTLRVIWQHNNTSNDAGADLSVYVYNKGRSQIGHLSRNNQPRGLSSVDTMNIYCRAADTVYFLVAANLCFSYTLRYEMVPPGTADPEPNGTFEQAVQISHNTPVQGRIGYLSVAQDVADYYYSVLPSDGTLRVIWQHNNTSNDAGADLSVYVYNKGRSQIGHLSRNNQPRGLSSVDTMNIYCRAADTVYFLVAANLCFSYTLRYEMVPPGTADPEPNGTFEQAVQISHNTPVQGRIGYLSVAQDVADYYYSVLPSDGTLRVIWQHNNTSNDAGADLNVYVYNKGRSQIGHLSRNNQPRGLSSVDTMNIYCRAADTVYFLVAANLCFSYTLRYEMVPPGTADPEPNGTFEQAVQISHNTPVQGRIGYLSVAQDVADYYYSVLPSDGTLRVIWQHNNTSNDAGADLNVYVYNKGRSQIGRLSRNNQPRGLSSVDTMDIYCRTADTVYFLVAANLCFSYTFSYEIQGNSAAGDPEPNNTRQTSKLIQLNDTLRGRVGYTGISRDTEDFFKFYNNRRRSIKVLVNGVNTSGTAASFTLSVGRLSNGSSLFSQTLSNLAPGAWTQGFNANCLPQDSLFIRLTTNQCGSYAVTFALVEEEPDVSFSIVRFGNEVTFKGNYTLADSIVWTIGAGDIRRNQRYPIKTFLPGVHYITLTGIDKQCNFRDSYRDTLVFTGIESYSPLKAGTDVGVGYFAMRIFGAGLDTAARVQLIRGNTVINPKKILSPNIRELTAQFSLNGVDTGYYDVKIVMSNNDVFNYPNGFLIFHETEDYKLVAKINGPARVRTGRWMNCSMDISNERSRIAIGVPAFIVAPKWVELDIAQTLQKRTGKLSIKGDRWNDLTLDPDDFNQVYFNGNFDPNRDTLLVDYDDIYTAFDSLQYFDISRFYDVPLDARVYPLYIPAIDGNSTYSYRFKMRSPISSDVKIRSYTWPFPFRNNPNTGEILDYVHTGGLQAAALAELAPNPALQAVGKSAGYVDIGSQVAFTEFFDWYYGTNVADDDFYARQGTALAGELAGELVPYGDRFQSAAKKADISKGAIRDATQYVGILEETIIGGGKLSPSMAARLSKELAAYKQALAAAGGNLSDAQKQELMSGLSHIVAKNGLNISSGELGELFFPDDPDLFVNDDGESFIPDVVSMFDFESLTSFDPNAIYGNTGVGDERYIRQRDVLSYQIAFENVDTARAPAQIVRVYTQLDPAKFDLSQTWLSHITIGGKLYTLESDRQELFRDIDLRPRLDLIVRVIAEIDTASGRMEWDFVSLDPATMDLTADPIAGFLPPNVNYPEGEGSVSFHTRLLPGAGDMTQLPLFADIYFDENAPIRTNTWSNTVDEKAPVTLIQPNIAVRNDTIMRLSLTGADSGSGLETYLLFIKKEGHEWLKKPLSIGLLDTLEVIGDPEATYHFYVTGKDSVGNIEQKLPVAEASVTLARSWPGEPFALYPNPSSGTVSLTANAPQGATQITVTDLSGRVVLQTGNSDWNGAPWRLDLSRHAPGLYVVRLSSTTTPVPVGLKLVRQP